MKKAICLILACLTASFFLNGCEQQKNTITSFNDVTNQKMGVMTGSIGETYTRERFPSTQIQSFDDIMDAVTAIKSGQIDGIVTIYPTALQVAKKNPDLLMLPEKLHTEKTAVAIKKGNEALLESVNAIITGLEKDGTLADMQKRWFKKDLTPYESVNISLPASGNPIRVGVSATREPLSFIDKNGNISGFDGEIARRIGEKLQRPVQFLNMKFMALIPALESGKIDMIISGINDTPERRKAVNFSIPYFANSQVMLVPKNETQGTSAVAKNNLSETPPLSMDNLGDKRIAVIIGTSGEKAAQSRFPKAEYYSLTSATDAAQAIRSGKVDAFAFDTSILEKLAAQNQDMMILQPPLSSLDVAIAIHKDNQELLAGINHTLAALKENGSLDLLKKKWLQNDPQVQIPEPASLPHVKGTLRAGTNTTLEPYSFITNGKISGFDVELAKLIGAQLGKKIEFVDMNLDSLVPALQSKKIDFILCNLNVTEERKKLVNFSDPYMQDGISIVVQKSAASPVSGDTFSTNQTGNMKITFLGSIADSFYNNLVLEDRYLLIIDGLEITIVIALLSSVFGTLLGALICFMRMSHNPVLNIPAKAYISTLRGTPVLVLLMLIFYVVFASVNINPVLVAIIAFGMNFAAYVAEMFRTGIESIDKGQSEAGIALGFTKFQTFIHIILPQALRHILPIYKGEFISLVKMTSIVGYIAVQDLTKASDIIRSRTFDAFFPLIMVAILYFLIAWILMQALEYVERWTDPRKKKKNKGGKS